MSKKIRVSLILISFVIPFGTLSLDIFGTNNSQKCTSEILKCS